MKKELLPIIQSEYYNFFERKGKFETKSIGFIAFISLLLTVSWTIFFDISSKSCISLFSRNIFFIIEISVNYWALLVILHALIVIWPRKIEKIDKDEVLLNAYNVESDETYSSMLLSTYIKAMNFNSPILTSIEFHNKISGLYLIFVLIMFITQIVFYFVLYINNIPVQ